MAAPSSRHAYLKQKIYESDDTACFITRERILQKLDLQYRTYYAYDRQLHRMTGKRGSWPTCLTRSIRRWIRRM